MANDPTPIRFTVLASTTKTTLSSPDGISLSVMIERTPGLFESSTVYDPPANAALKGKTLSGYIESAEGCQFKVVVEDRRAAKLEALVAMLYLDGTQMESYVMDHRRGQVSCTFVGHRDGPTTVRPFTFSKLQLTDEDDQATNDETIVRSMGTIAVKIYRVAVTGVSVPKVNFAPPPRASVLHERSKKAQLSHQTGLGAAIPSPSPTTISVDWYDRVDNPWYTLELAYRSRTLLELSDIIPESEHQPAPVAAAAPAAGPSNSKKRGAVITLSDSDDEAPKVKKEKGIKTEVKKEKVKGEKVVLELD